MSRSTITDDYAVVRLRESVRHRRWFMHRNGPHGTLRCLRLAYALALVEAGAAKLPGGQSLCWLRQAVEHAARSAAA